MSLRAGERVVVHESQAVGGRVQMTPAQLLVLGYSGIILLGTLLLMLPQSTVNGRGLSLMEALFTATSSVCVTGLNVVNVGAHLSFFGQVVLMMLIQVGALGLMTMSTLFALIMGRPITFRDRLFIKEDLNYGYVAGIVRLVRHVLGMTALIETVGAGLLMAVFYPRYGLGKGLFFSVFHSISAFANAGFDLMGNSLMDYAAHPLAVFAISGLVIAGGLGFAVLIDIIQIRRYSKMPLHSKLVIRVSSELILLGMLTIMALEWTNPKTLGQFGIGGKLLASFFTSVSPRTAGFNVVDTASLLPGTILIVMILMFIGASPGSTGGGVKTTTFAVLVRGVYSVIKGKHDVEIGQRRLPQWDFGRAVAIISLAGAVVLTVTTLLLITQPDLGFVEVLFETVSAFGTVGLSMGITAELNGIGRFLVILTMFVGRVGPMTVAIALGKRHLAAGNVRYSEEKISLG